LKKIENRLARGEKLPGGEKHINRVVAGRTARRVAIVGRPNVGKSTLFNRLVGKRRAITDSQPGVTRDLIEEWCHIGDETVLLTDTGGYKVEREGLDHQVAERTLEAAEKADVLLLMVDVEEMTGEDHFFIEEMRKFEKKTILVVNKVDNEKREEASWNYYSLGFDEVISISAVHGRNMDALKEKIEEMLSRGDSDTHVNDAQTAERRTAGMQSADRKTADRRAVTAVEMKEKRAGAEDKGEEAISAVRLAILGKPNTGKSTLLNYLLGEEKSMVSEIPGTTRDTVEGYFQWAGIDFRVIDTAGIRRKKKIEERVEYYSVNRAIKSIDRADIVYILIDAVDGLSEQDKKIAGLAVRKGRGVILVLNKWDLLEDIPNRLEAMKDRVKFQFPVLSYAPIVNISALNGSGIEKLLRVTMKVWKQLNYRIDTSQLNKLIEKWLEEYPIPVRGKNVKIMYATQVSVNPVSFVFFVNNKKGFPSLYLRYLENRIRRDLRFDLIPFHLEIRLK